MAKKRDELTFEKALEKLERTVSDMEEGEMALDDMLKKFEEGMELARFCGERLDRAEKKVEILVGKQGGGRKLEPFGGPAPDSADEE